MAPSTRERRVVATKDLRAKKAEHGASLEGYAAVFDSYSLDMGFRERIAQGAFAGALERSDVRALFNHDPNYVLGRSKSGTLTLAEDEHGLRVAIDLPDSQVIRDLVLTPVERGDISQMSFGFTTRRDQWAKVGDEWVRTLLEIEELFDVSPVTFAAYPDTDVAARGFDRAKTVAPPEDVMDAAADLDLRRRGLQLRLTATR